MCRAGWEAPKNRLISGWLLIPHIFPLPLCLGCPWQSPRFPKRSHKPRTFPLENVSWWNAQCSLRVHCPGAEFLPGPWVVGAAGEAQCSQEAQHALQCPAQAIDHRAELLAAIRYCTYQLNTALTYAFQQISLHTF